MNEVLNKKIFVEKIEKKDMIVYRPLYNLAISILEEKMPFIKYEPLA